MKYNLKKIGTYALFLVIGIALGNWFFSTSSSADAHPHDHETESVESVWSCSMHPEIREAQAGNCPICGMALTRIENTATTLDPNAIAMSREAMQLAKVATAYPLASPSSEGKLVLDGKLLLNEELQQKVTAEFHGRVDQMYVRYEGQQVSKNQVIAEVYSPELESLQRELLIAAKQKDKNPRLYEASIRKLKNWNISQQEIDLLLNMGKVQGTTKIRSQYTGVVSNLNVRQGNHIERGDLLFEINDISQLWASFEVYEKDAIKVQVGDVVNFTAASYPSQTWQTKINFVAPVLDDERRSFKVRAEVSNTDLQLKPSFIIKGEIQQNTPLSNSLWLPKSAVLWTGKRSVVYKQLQEEDQIGFVMKEVETGKTSGDLIEIISGISIDDEVAVSGVFTIDAASQIAAKPSMMNRRTQTLTNTEINWGEVKLDTPQFKEIVRTYLSLKESLAEDNEQAALGFAKELQNEINNLGFENKEAKNAFSALAKDVANSKNIEVARKHFQYLSDALIAIVKQGNPLSETIYVQFCPMADNDQGAFWLSTEPEIKNPYFGSTMLRCGNVEEMLE